ncbi:fungal-specific transcription factor domain-containing protein [Aspergillus cavernicola]|uniref:Fungal-specific transcription factor domain-containing protein n=1 Tax=Aspergillus cavernicola TaxID=176166 RepID=A0ABR4I9H4_9EURO
MPLRRAKQACVHCHSRRIRCDVLQNRPCSNCVSQDVKCAVGVSRRGKYPRKKSVKVQSAQHQPEQETLQIATPSTTTAHSVIDKNVPTQTVNVFLGESCPLTSVMNPSQPPRLHYPLPDRLSPTSTRNETVRLHQVQRAAQLESDGSLSFPSPQTTDTLLQAYFRWFHPCFPVVNRVAVYRARAQGTLSPLLLQAMLFIGVSLCDDETFARTEFPVRYPAKFLLYSRAKAIYEADVEASPTVTIQALFLLSFWRAAPSDERDVRYWLGVAISLAQKRGMHMMSRFSHPPKDQKLWKRIWWALYTRDQQSAAALGLPPRIRDEDGDVSMLKTDDIREDEFIDDDVFERQKPQHLVYPVEMAKLARLLCTIVSTQYLHHQRPDPVTKNALNQQLSIWESQLPFDLRLDTVTSETLLLTGLLHLTCQNLYILLHRRVFLNPTPQDSGQIALDAATKSTRIMEDLLSHHLVQHGPTHLITHAFSTLCIHTIHHCRSSGITRTLAEHRARLCLLSLEELHKSWDLENWVLQLFFRGLDAGTAMSLRLTSPHEVGGGGTGTGTGNTSSERPGDFPEDRLQGEGIQRRQGAEGPERFNLPQDDWFGWIPGDDEGDALDLQNLEFLYRFL